MGSGGEVRGWLMEAQGQGEVIDSFSMKTSRGPRRDRSSRGKKAKGSPSKETAMRKLPRGWKGSMMMTRTSVDWNHLDKGNWVPGEVSGLGKGLNSSEKTKGKPTANSLISGFHGRFDESPAA